RRPAPGHAPDHGQAPHRPGHRGRRGQAPAAEPGERRRHPPPVRGGARGPEPRPNPVSQEGNVEDAPAIETLDLRKRYGPVEALRGLTLRVARGSLHGFLGRSGSGKTTTVKILLGMTRPRGGSARVLGRAAGDAAASVEIRRRVGFVSEDKQLYDAMTTAQILRFTAACYPTWRPDLEQHYLEAFALRPEARVRTLSRGARTLLALTLALCRGAELLILDEPTSGLDPAMVERVLQALVRHVAREQSTIFFSSHQIAEVEQIADSLAIVDHGRVVVAGELDELLGRYRR